MKKINLNLIETLIEELVEYINILNVSLVDGFKPITIIEENTFIVISDFKELVFKTQFKCLSISKNIKDNLCIFGKNEDLNNIISHKIKSEPHKFLLNLIRDYIKLNKDSLDSDYLSNLNNYKKTLVELVSKETKIDIQLVDIYKSNTNSKSYLTNKTYNIDYSLYNKILKSINISKENYKELVACLLFQLGENLFDLSFGSCFIGAEFDNKSLNIMIIDKLIILEILVNLCKTIINNKNLEVFYE